MTPGRPIFRSWGNGKEEAVERGYGSGERLGDAYFKGNSNIEALQPINMAPIKALRSEHTIVAESHAPICPQRTHRPTKPEALLFLIHHLTISTLCTTDPSFSHISAWAATPTSPCFRWRTTSSSLSWRRSNKGEIHLDRLIQKLRIMRTINRRSRLIQGRVFDQRVALNSNPTLVMILIPHSPAVPLPASPFSRSRQMAPTLT